MIVARGPFLPEAQLHHLALRLRQPLGQFAQHGQQIAGNGQPLGARSLPSCSRVFRESDLAEASPANVLGFVGDDGPDLVASCWAG